MHSVVYSLCIVLLLLVAQTQCICPYSQSGLKAWSAGSSWPGGVVPAAGTDVVIPAGVSILLDISPPPLNSIYVTGAGSKLIWGNYNGLELVTGYLIVDNFGEFWVGSEDCLFANTATITLTGSPQSVNKTNFGNKVLGCGANGTVELHGAAYTPTWTHLSKTISTYYYSQTPMGRGLNIAALDPVTGYKIASGSFDTFGDANASAAVVTFLNAQPAGRVVAVVCADECSNQLSAAAKTALQGIGSARVNDLKYRSGWVCIGVQGAAVGSAVESIVNETSRPTPLTTRTFTNFLVNGQSYQPYGGLLEVKSAGTPTIYVADATNWKVGQKIVVASSSNDWKQAEQNEIVTVVSSTQFVLKYSFNYTHWGQIESGVDERAEVGLLTRNIVIRGQMVNDSDTWGAHTKYLLGFKNVHVENVEFYSVGQPVIGTYPVHFHMAADVDAVGKYTSPAYVKGNSIWHTFNRCVTIHGTHGLLVQNNVAYDAMGHCYFFEDGSEQRNVVDRNLGLSTKYGKVLLSDVDPATCSALPSGTCLGPATFWIENPNNVITNNAAAGSIAFGIWYVFPSNPTGLSAPLYPSVNIPYIPLGVFGSNTAHSSPTGLMVDDGVITNSSSPIYLGITGARYRPHVNATYSNPRAPASFNDLTVHHCNQGAWLRGGDYRIYRVRSADNLIGVTLASEGANPNDPGSSQEIYNGIFVGITANNNGSLLNTRIKGFEIYDGPIKVINTSFVNFPDLLHNSSAIAAKSNNVWQIGATNEVSGASFNNVAQRLYYQVPVNDGDRNNIIRDTDGSVCGLPKNAIVSPLDIHKTKRCTFRSDFNAIVCPDKYGQIFIVNMDVAHTNYNTSSVLTLFRDEASSSPMNLTGTGGVPVSTRFQPLVLINKTYTLHFSHPSPPYIQIQLSNFDAQDYIRIGVCYPQVNSSFVVNYKVGGKTTPLVSLGSLGLLDATTNTTSGYYWDSSTGLLFVKIIAYYPRVGLNYCGSAGCEVVEITASGPNVGKASGYCANAYPKYSTTEP